MYPAAVRKQAVGIMSEIHGIAPLQHGDPFFLDVLCSDLRTADRSCHSADRIRIAAEIRTGQTACFRLLEIVRHRQSSRHSLAHQCCRADDFINGERERLLICPHINRPGVIGTVGSIMGEAGINISSMQVGKSDREGMNIMVLTIDHDIPDDTLARVLAVDGIFDAKLVNFETI